MQFLFVLIGFLLAQIVNLLIIFIAGALVSNKKEPTKDEWREL